MAVFRIERTRDYTVMSNHHLRNANLSLKVKGLLSMMLSLPEDWNYTTPTRSPERTPITLPFLSGVYQSESHTAQNAAKPPVSVRKLPDTSPL